ncbi:MAG: SAM-dependent methyltransferase, partial [Jiangellaceae bacterium]
MAGAPVPDRIRQAVQLLEIGPHDEVLEIGCGPGVAASLVCEQLRTGHLTAIDRSATAIGRAAGRNAQHVESGRLELLQVDLAGLQAPGRRFDKIFAVNVNLFWVRAADLELQVVTDALRPDGTLYLFYEAPSREKAGQVAATISAGLTAYG